KEATAVRNGQATNFLPTLTATYRYTHHNEEMTSQPFTIPDIDITIPPTITIPGMTIPGYVLRPEDEYAFVFTATQPIFTGFGLINGYRLADMGLDSARINEKLTRLEIIYKATEGFFLLLKAQKILDVVQETVSQVSAHRNVAANFYEVGMIPLNDLLKAEVELANAKQELVSTENNLELARSNYNLILHRPVNSPVEIVDIFSYTPFENDLDYCLAVANRNRLEVKIATLQVKMAKTEMRIAQKDYFPTVMLRYNYYQLGTEWDVQGGEGIQDTYSWDVVAEAQWNFWEWGRSYFHVKEKESRLKQAQLQLETLEDQILLEVKQSYLKTREAEKNIVTIKKAIHQARENYRITTERYKEQLSTSTDVIDAQTLLSRTMTNYYNALYDLKLSKASLYKSMSVESIQ
ncbi:MAG: TolC family protein, partial [Desulfobacterales bacterium]|nr:TolC family protein [Desulfobacterales bacterium]